MLRHDSCIISRSQFHGGGGTHIMYITIMVAIVLTCRMTESTHCTDLHSTDIL